MLRCFYKSNFSCSGFIVVRIACVQTSPISFVADVSYFLCNKGNRRRLHAGKVQPWNSIDLPDPVGKTPIISWPFRVDSKHFTWRGLKLSDGKWKVAVLWILTENLTRRSTDKNSGLPAMFDVLLPTNSGCLVVMWAADARAFSPPTSKAREKAPCGRGWDQTGYCTEK